MFAVERTYSEWELSAFNSETGVYLPQFGGNDHWVASCQDCHMQTITGAGATLWGNTLIRDDMPVHDLTGANTWVPGLIPQVDEFAELFRQEPERLEALESGVDRARAMLQNAAALSVVRDGNTLAVTVTNQSGHKLPSGYIEGRRMWIEVRGYDADGELVYSSGLYDPVSAEIEGYHADPTLKVYEAQQGLTPDWAAQVGLEPGHSFHFMLNNTTLFDNRIPPMGYSFEAFNAVQAAPVTNGQPDPNRYADGQFWDTTLYTLPDGVVRGEVRLLHQIASKEYIEFLRDENPNPDGNRGDIMYELWEENGKSPPEVMASQTFSEQTWQTFMPSITRQ